MEWKLIAPGVWECSGTRVTVQFRPKDNGMLPYQVFWEGSKITWCHEKKMAFILAEKFIGELTEAGMDA